MKTVKLILILITLTFGGFFCLKNSFLASAQSVLAKNNLLKNWRPTKTVAGIKYVGNQECLKCHDDKQQQLSTPMAHAILQPADSKFRRRLRAQSAGKFRHPKRKLVSPVIQPARLRTKNFKPNISAKRSAAKRVTDRAKIILPPSEAMSRKICRFLIRRI